MPERRAEVESVDWASLEVHGAPDDVPVAFHAIWSDDEDQRKLGYHNLSRGLGHGASSSPASIAAVPFLLDVVADPHAPSRFAACQVLLQIAIGEEEITLNERPDFAYWRREAQRKASLTVAELEAEQAAWIAAAPDPAERRAREVAAFFRDVEDERETERVNAEAYDAVRASVPVYLTALSADDVGTRMYAAQLLAYFPEDASSIVPALLPLIGGPDAIVASAAAVAAGICARGSADPAAAAAITARWERAGDRADRWATAIALAQLLNHPTADVLADVEAAAEAPAPLPHFPFLEGDIAALAGYTLDRLEDKHALPSGPWSA
jgi:hypothetical protein